MSYVRRVLIALGLATAIIVLLYLIWQVGQAVLVIFASCLVGVFLSGCGGWLSRKTGLKYPWCLLIVVLVIVAFVSAAAAFLTVQIVQQAYELYAGLVDAFEAARRWIERFGWGEKLLEQTEEGDGIQLTDLAPAVQVVSAALGAVTMGIVIVVIGLYLAGAPQLYKKGLLRLVPREKRHRAGQVLDAVGRALQGWLLAQFISMTVIGTLVAIGLFLFGIELWLILGLLAGLLTFIPNLGPIIAAVPTVLIALNESPAVAAGVVIYFTFVQMLEGYLVTPMVQDRVIRLPPAGILSVQILMGYTFGILGVAVAAPLLAATMVAVEMLYVQDILGDRNLEITGEKNRLTGSSG